MLRDKKQTGALIGVLAAGLAVTACGSSAAPTTIDSARVESAIERSSLDQRGVHASVTCPADVRQKKGVGFSCTAVAGRTRTRFVVSQLDGSGHVRYEGR
jgi:hypothetical protein